MIILFIIESVFLLIAFVLSFLGLFRRLQYFWLERKFQADLLFQQKLKRYRQFQLKKRKKVYQLIRLFLILAFGFGLLLIWQYVQYETKRIDKIVIENQRLSEQVKQLDKNQTLPTYPDEGLNLGSLPWTEATDNQPKTQKILIGGIRAALQNFFGSAFPQADYLAEDGSLQITFPLVGKLSQAKYFVLSNNVEKLIQELQKIPSLYSIKLNWQVNHIHLSKVYSRQNDNEKFILEGN